MRRFLFRFLIGGLFAVLMALLSLALVQAEAPQATMAASALPQEGQPAESKCQLCHTDFHTSWLEGAHGSTTSEPKFKAAWEAEGSPRQCLTCHTTGYDGATDTFVSEGVTCEACHSPAPTDHPKEPMPTDRSGKLCGDCHAETFFEWQASKHRETELACVSCHDPHATDLKGKQPANLCMTCHRDRASNFAHSPHSQMGLTCADCHLGPLDQTGEGHAARDHSFNVRLTTCNTCHAYQMHDPVEVHPDHMTPTPTPQPDTLAAVETLAVTGEPSPVSPIGFAMLSGLVGLAAGMVLAPWLERWYRRVNRHAEPPVKDEEN
jgi:predicted CXXCH cytochrome family protein